MFTFLSDLYLLMSGRVIDLPALHNDPQIVVRGRIIRQQIPRCVTCLLMADEIMAEVPNLARLVLINIQSPSDNCSLSGGM